MRQVAIYVLAYSAVDVFLWSIGGHLSSPWDTIVRAIAFLLAVAIVLYVVVMVLFVRWFIPRLTDFIRAVTNSPDL